MLNLSIKKLRFPNNGSIVAPITVGLYIKGYYDPDSAFVLIEDNVPVAVDGTVLASPLPITSIDPTRKYVIKAVNELCDFVYEQDFIIYPYCPSGFILSEDKSSCFMSEETAATPPTNSENAVAVSGPNNFYYGIFGTLIFDPGYNVNGTGSFTQISYSNPFWVNGAGYPHFPSVSDTAGPLNRAGVWSSTVASPQQIGFSVCIEAPEDGTYYVAMGCDDIGQVNVDGATVILQDRNALKTFIQANGYAYPGGLDPNQVTFNFWYVYPVFLTKGSHVIELIGNNTSGTVPGAAAIGCEVYNLTSAEIQAATSYVDMGAGLIFSSKDYIGRPIQLGTGGIGYTCPPDYSLKYCESPIVCVRTITTPVLY